MGTVPSPWEKGGLEKRCRKALIKERKEKKTENTYQLSDLRNGGKKRNITLKINQEKWKEKEGTFHQFTSSREKKKKRKDGVAGKKNTWRSTYNWKRWGGKTKRGSATAARFPDGGKKREKESKKGKVFPRHARTGSIETLKAGFGKKRQEEGKKKRSIIKRYI